MTEVASVFENDRSKLFYDETFLKSMEEAHKKMGQVTAKDIKTTTSKSKVKKVEDFKHHDENTRIFNLKWHHNPNSQRVSHPSAVS